MTDLENSIFDAIDQTSSVLFDKDDYRHQLFIGICVSILERCHAVVALIQVGKVYDAEIILRSAFEHYVEAANIIADKDFHWHSQAEFLKFQRIKLEAARGGNEFLRKIAENIPIEAELVENRKRSEQIVELGGKKIGLEAKCRSVGLHQEYDSIFRSLSNQVHPTYAGIIKRHLKITSEDGDFEVKGFAQPDKLSRDIVIDTTKQIIELTMSLAESFEAETSE